MDLNPIELANNQVPTLKLLEDIRLSVAPKQNDKLKELNDSLYQGDNLFGGVGIQGKQRLSMEDQISIAETHALVGDEWLAKYPTFKIGRDNAEYAAQTQSGLEQAFNGITKSLNNVGTVIAGNTAGFVYGLSDWAKTGNFNSVFDNSFSKTLDEWNTKLNYQLPNYYTKQAQESGFWGQAMENPINTVFNDVLNGVSFTVGTIASEAIWAYATGGASLALRGGQTGARIANAGRWGKMFLGAEKAADGLKTYKGFVNQALSNAVKTGKLEMSTAATLGKIGGGLNTARFVATSSGNEAGIEAFHFKKEATENFYHNFEQMYNRLPNAEEVQKFEGDIEEAATGVFMSNMAILGVSNLAMIGGMFGIKSPIGTLQKEANKKIFGVGVEKSASGVFKAVDPTKLQKVSRALYIPIAPTVREGLFEEALQGTATKAANLWVERQYNPKYINKAVDIMDVALEAAREQYGTKEGWKDIWIGGIVGLLGGGVTGEFSQFKRAQAEIEKVTVPSLNAQENLATTLTTDINARRISTTALQLEAQDRADKAMSKGDVVAAKLAQYDAIIAGWQLEDNPVVRGDSKNLTDKLKLAIDASEVTEDEKQDLKGGLDNLYKMYQNASSFAESIVGSQGRIYGTEHSSQVAKEALTYVMVQGQNANQLMNDTLNELGDYLNEDLLQAIKRNEDLTTLGKEAKRQLKNASQRYKYLEKKSEAVQQKVRELQAAPKEIEGDRQSRLVEMQNQLIQIETDKQGIRVEVEQLTSKLSQSKKSANLIAEATLATELDTLGEFISVDDLLTLDTKLEELESSYKTMQEISPANAQIVKGLMDRYNTAKKSLLEYNSASSAIAQGKFKPSLASSNPFSNAFRKLKDESKKGDEFTKSFLDELITLRNAKATNYIESNQQIDLQKAKARLNELNSIDELSEQEQEEKAQIESLIRGLSSTDIVEQNEDTPTRRESAAEITPTDTVEFLKGRIDEVLTKFKSEFVGAEDIDEKIKNRPDQKDIDRYRELVNSEDRDEQEFQTLKQKLSQWRVYDSLLVNDNESVADLLDQVAALEAEIDEIETVTDATPEVDKSEDLDTNISGKVDNFSLTQNTNFPPTIKVAPNNQIILTHVKIPQLLSRFSNPTDLKLNGKKITEDKLEELKFADRISFEDNGLKRIFTIGVGMSIEMAQEDFLAIPDITTTNKATASITNWSYSILYELTANGEILPMQSDFADNTVTGHTNDLKQGDTIEFYVDVNHEYNKKLMEQYKKGKIEKKDLVKSVVVHIRKNGQNYQTLKGLSDRVDVKGAKIVEVRNAAAEKLESEISGQIGTTQIERVELGTPVLTVTENGTITTMSITERGLENVAATGYIQDGEITLNKKLNEDIRRTFISKTSKNNKGKKVPFVVIKQGKQLIAFPIRLNKIPSPKGNLLEDILSNDILSDSQKVVAINKLLSDNKISPRKFDLINLEQEDKLDQIFQALNEVESFITADEIADKKYKIKDLQKDAEISLDLENLSVYLPSQKLLLNMENVNLKEENLEENKEITEQVNQVVSNINFQPIEKPKTGKLIFTFLEGGKTIFNKKPNGKWYFTDSKGEEQKESEKNQPFLEWVYNRTEDSQELDEQIRAEFKIQYELEKTKKDAEC